MGGGMAKADLKVKDRKVAAGVFELHLYWFPIKAH